MNADERAVQSLSAEELKHEIELYLRAHFPRGRMASVQFHTGDPDAPPETLVILLDGPPSSEGAE